MTSISDELRKAMRQWTTGVSIVCSKNDTYQHGMTVNSFTSVSLEPPLIIITLANSTRTCHLINETDRFSVSILNQNQKHISDRFSGKDEDIQDRFEGIETDLLPDGMPVIRNALTVIAGKVVNKIVLENSTLFLAEVYFTETSANGRPLVYHNREYFSL